MTIRELAIAVGFKVDESSKKKAEGDVNNLASMAKKVLGTITAVVSISGIKQFASNCVSMASDVAEMESKFNVVFGDMSDEVNKWATDFAKAIGRNKNTIKTYLADQQNLLVGFGATREEGANLSKQMTSLALDIASFANTDESAAVNYMTKAVMGETEAAKMLGAVLSDVTREEAMLQLGYSGKYDSLTQLQKMYVNYTAIVNQSKDAVGDCANSMGRYESNTRVLNAGLEELKETIGTGLMPLFNAGLKMVIPIVNGITSVVKRVTGVGTEVNKMEVFLEKATNAIKWLTDKMGGAENAMRVLAISAGILIGALSFNKVVSGMKMLLNFLKTVGLKGALIIAVIVAIALIIDDLINFLKGNDSLFGTMLEKAGIDCDKLRETIFNTWDVIKDKLLVVWEHIKEAGSQVWEALKIAAELIFEGLKIFWNTWGEEIKAYFVAFFSYCSNIFNAFLEFLIGVADFIGSVFSGDWEGAWEAIKNIFTAVWNGIVAFFSSIWDAIILVAKIALGTLASLLSKIINAVKENSESIKEAIVNGINAAIEWIKNLPEQAKTWGKDFIDGFVGGIKSAIGKVTEGVKEVADTVTSFLHFSVPDEGPLTTYESWMPDMMQGLGKGIKNNRSKVLDEVKSLASDMSYLVQSGTANAQSVANGSVTNNSTRNVTQNVNISNSYTGSDIQAQQNVSKAMNKSANDATSYMARGLAFAR